MEIRAVERLDIPSILGLINELAVYENAPDEVINTVEQLEIDLIEDQCCHAVVCENEGVIVAFALYYTSYSTWRGKCLYLEDLYVQESWRKHGIGQKLFDTVVNVAKTSNYRRMDWQVLNWNTPAIKFYEKNNAVLDPEWINGRLYF